MFGVSREIGCGVVVVLVGGWFWCVEVKWFVNFGCLCRCIWRVGVRGVCIIVFKVFVYILVVWFGVCIFEVVVKVFVVVYFFVWGVSLVVCVGLGCSGCYVNYL